MREGSAEGSGARAVHAEVVAATRSCDESAVEVEMAVPSVRPPGVNAQGKRPLQTEEDIRFMV